MGIQIKKKPYNKFGNVPKICRQGIKHKSSSEADHCDKLYLESHSRDSQVVKIHHELRYLMTVNGKLVCTHSPDWTLELKDGTKKVVEYKGIGTPSWKLKKKLFEALFPHIPYTVVYKSDMFIKKGRKRAK